MAAHSCNLSTSTVVQGQLKPHCDPLPQKIELCSHITCTSSSEKCRMFTVLWGRQFPWCLQSVTAARLTFPQHLELLENSGPKQSGWRLNPLQLLINQAETI